MSVFKGLHTQRDLEAFALHVARATRRACAVAEFGHDLDDWSIRYNAIVQNAVAWHNGAPESTRPPSDGGETNG